MNAKKGPFQLSIDLTQIPSFKTRFMSLDRVAGGINLKQEYVSTKPARDADKNLREKFGSGHNPFTVPSTILRKKGLGV